MSTEQTSSIKQIATRIGEVVGTNKVFGEPIHSDGVTVIPVTRISGGGGGGGGNDADRGEGFGGGLGWGSSATGVYVVHEGTVSWRPAVDVNRIVITGAAVLISALATIRAVARARHR
jgi:uncharacterized spore protein YtfJ